jgi:mandelate racemase
MQRPRLTLRRLSSRAVLAPMRRPLGTSVARMDRAPFLLVEAETEEGVTGRAHAFCYQDLAIPTMRRVIDRAGEIAAGQAVDPEAIAALLGARFALIGTPGIVGMALSALDVALWDALGVAAGTPLADLLGRRRAAIPAYNSNGLSLTDPDALGDEAAALRADGFDAVKIRLGRPHADADLRAIRAVREAIGPDAPLMADFNQALSADEALRRAPALDAAGLAWVEEPVAHDDYAGCARLAAALGTPVQIGENFCGPNPMAAALAARACDLVMPDLMRIGGVSGWLRAAAMAEAGGLPMSSHLYPEVSVHLLTATPTAHWLEYIDWAEPFLAEPLAVADGMAAPSDRPGTGVAWDEAAIRKYAVD